MRILAADIGGTKTKICICDEQGSIEQFKEYETESSLGGHHVIARLLDNIAEYDNYDCIAISTAGQVNTEEGYIVYANENIPDYTGMRVKDILTKRFGVPVKVENDVNAAALGEAYFGAGKSFSHFLCLTYGTGIGGSIMIDRKLYRGAGGVAAEFGHIFTHPPADRTASPREAYYEAFASTTALVKLALDVDPKCIDGKTIFDKIRKGDIELERIVDQWADEVSLGLASFIHVFNPEAIIVGGGVMEQQALVQLIEAKSKALVMDSFRDVVILRAALGNKAGVLGAASMFLS